MKVEAALFHCVPQTDFAYTLPTNLFNASPDVRSANRTLTLKSSFVPGYMCSML